MREPSVRPIRTGRAPSDAASADGSAARRRATPLAMLACVVVPLATGGCSNPFSAEGAEVGVYKGASDPLLEQPAADRDAALRERLELIQKRGAAVPES